MRVIMCVVVRLFSGSIMGVDSGRTRAVWSSANLGGSFQTPKLINATKESNHKGPSSSAARALATVQVLHIDRI